MFLLRKQDFEPKEAPPPPPRAQTRREAQEAIEQPFAAALSAIASGRKLEDPAIAQALESLKAKRRAPK